MWVRTNRKEIVEHHWAMKIENPRRIPENYAIKINKIKETCCHLFLVAISRIEMVTAWKILMEYGMRNGRSNNNVAIDEQKF